jgi:hypothetical protein
VPKELALGRSEAHVGHRDLLAQIIHVRIEQNFDVSEGPPARPERKVLLKSPSSHPAIIKDRLFPESIDRFAQQ